MADNKLMGKIEAVLFASGDPVEVAKLSQILKADKGEIDNALEGLKKKYAKTNSGIQMLELQNSVQLSNKEEFGDYIKEALLVKRNAPLSTAAMEVLSIIAYNQPEPVTKSFIEQIRGVDSSATVNSLVEKGLVEEAGRHNLPGRPIVYRTTEVFLRSFGISNLTELPPLPSPEEQLDLGLTENTSKDEVTQTTQKEEVTETTQKEEVAEIAQKAEVPETTQKEEVTETTQKEEVTETAQKEEVTETTQKEEVVEITQKEEVAETTQKEEVDETIN